MLFDSCFHHISSAGGICWHLSHHYMYVHLCLQKALFSFGYRCWSINSETRKVSLGINPLVFFPNLQHDTIPYPPPLTQHSYYSTDGAKPTAETLASFLQCLKMNFWCQQICCWKHIESYLHALAVLEMFHRYNLLENLHSLRTVQLKASQVMYVSEILTAKRRNLTLHTHLHKFWHAWWCHDVQVRCRWFRSYRKDPSYIIHKGDCLDMSFPCTFSLF